MPQSQLNHISKKGTRSPCRANLSLFWFTWTAMINASLHTNLRQVLYTACQKCSEHQFWQVLQPTSACHSCPLLFTRENWNRKLRKLQERSQSQLKYGFATPCDNLEPCYEKNTIFFLQNIVFVCLSVGKRKLPHRSSYCNVPRCFL